MIRKNKVAAIAVLVSAVLATTPLMFLAQGQMQSAPAEQVVTIAEKAAEHVQALIDLIDSDEDALVKIEAAGLKDEYGTQVADFAVGLRNLTDAQEALTVNEEDAVDYAVDALKIFRDVYSSIHVIMEEADIQKCDLTENQELADAITRNIGRIERLREILPENTPLEISQLLDDAEDLLTTAQSKLLDGDLEAAKTALHDAKDLISQVFAYLKEQAEESNEWRLSGYCTGLQERIRERFRYGQQQGADFTSVLQSYGYQSETQFMEALQNKIQKALGEQDFGAVLRDCEELSQMVQQMEQAVNQEIGRHQAQNGSGGSGSGGSGSGSTGAGGSGSGAGSGYGGPGGA